MTAQELIAWIEGYVSGAENIPAYTQLQIAKKIAEYREASGSINLEILQHLRKWDVHTQATRRDGEVYAS